MTHDIGASLLDGLQRLLADIATPAALRGVERDPTAAAAMWAQIEASGFADAMVPEAAGGAGLSLSQALPLFVEEGRRALPVPLAHTMLVRAALSAQGLAVPQGAITIAPTTLLSADGSASCTRTPYAAVAPWVVASTPGGWRLLPTAAARSTTSGVKGSHRADLQWPRDAVDAEQLMGSAAWPDAGAAVTAALLAGTLQTVLQATLDFANQRVQFGRSIGKFQAIQHQLAVMAEHVQAAHMAAAIGCAAESPWPEPLRAAAAKARCSEAAALVASIAHAVHGAIGVTAEFDLQLFTRRLHEGRADFGAESHWHGVLGRALLAAPEAATLPFMHRHLMP